MQTQYIRIFSFFLPECEPAETFRDEVLERLGDGELPWILGELKKMDYRGFASIEPHLSGGDFVPGTGADKFAAAANALKGLLAQI